MTFQGLRKSEVAIGKDHYLLFNAEYDSRKHSLSIYLGQFTREEDGGFMIRGLRTGKKAVQVLYPAERRWLKSGDYVELEDGETVELKLK